MVFNLIKSCILRKKQHCLDYRILKRPYPDYTFESIDETQDINQNFEMFEYNISDTAIDHTVTNFKTKRPRTCLPSYNDSLNKNIASDINNNINNTFPLSNNPIDDLSNEIYKIYNITCDNVKKELRKNYESFLSGEIDRLDVFLKLYLVKNFSEKRHKHYFSRIDNIKKNHEILISSKHQHENPAHVFEEIDFKIITLFNCMLSTFDLNSHFTSRDSENFLLNLFFTIREVVNSKKLIKYFNKTIKDKKILFNRELFNSVKHFKNFPELIALGGINSEYLLTDVVFTIHLVNLLLDQFGNNEKTKVFVRFLIDKALKHYKNHKKNIHFIDFLQINCLKNQTIRHRSNLYFLTWEFNKSRRADIRKRLKENNNMLIFGSGDRKHFNLVVLVFLYQHIILSKNKNDNNAIIDKRYVKIVSNILTDRNNCFACDFEELIEIFSN